MGCTVTRPEVVVSTQSEPEVKKSPSAERSRVNSVSRKSQPTRVEVKVAEPLPSKQRPESPRNKPDPAREASGVATATPTPTISASDVVVRTDHNDMNFRIGKLPAVSGLLCIHTTIRS